MVEYCRNTIGALSRILVMVTEIRTVLRTLVPTTTWQGEPCVIVPAKGVKQLIDCLGECQTVIQSVIEEEELDSDE